MEKESLKKTKLPDKPGVYFFLKGTDILYIGKATSLSSRVMSYFGKDLIETRGPIIFDMVFKADKIKWQISDSVLEALILEANLIKKHQPKYNTKEKSDKSFNYVCITKEKLPKVVIKRGQEIINGHKNLRNCALGDKRAGNPHVFLNSYAHLFGPFTNSSQLKEALKIIRRIFPFLDDKSKNYYKFYRQVDLVPDILSKEGIKQYQKNIRNIKLFFEGKKKKILKNLEKEMKEYAKIHAFEKAGKIKKQIFALKHINDVALIKGNVAGNEIFDPAPYFGRIKGNKAGPSDAKILLPATAFRIEAYDIAHMGGKNMVGVMVVIQNGELDRNEYRKFKIKTQNNANDTGALFEVLERRFYHPEWRYPNLIVVDGNTAQVNIAKRVLRNKNKSDIPVVAVVKDEHHKSKEIMGNKELTLKYKREILLANSEAHRFAINYHKNMRAKNFLK